MIDKEQIMPLNFFAYGGIYTGVHGNMRYRMVRVGEKPDFKLEAACWRGPYGYDAMTRNKDDEALIKRSLFDFDDDGRDAAIEWLQGEYDANLAYYDAATSLLDAQIRLDEMYGDK